MKHTIFLTTLITGAVLGLSACGGSSGGGGGGAAAVTQFNGTWNGACEEATAARSFKQKWIINGGELNNDISVWLTSNCQPGNALAIAKGKASVEYQQEVDVANTCADGKAQEVKLDYTSLVIGSEVHNGEVAINGFLNPQGITLPKYSLICKDADGNLRTGLITVDKDGTTVANRPTEMDSVNFFTP